MSISHTTILARQLPVLFEIPLPKQSESKDQPVLRGISWNIGNALATNPAAESKEDRISRQRRCFHALTAMTQGAEWDFIVLQGVQELRDAQFVIECKMSELLPEGNVREFYRYNEATGLLTIVNPRKGIRITSKTGDDCLSAINVKLGVQQEIQIVYCDQSINLHNAFLRRPQAGSLLDALCRPQAASLPTPDVFLSVVIGDIDQRPGPAFAPCPVPIGTTWATSACVVDASKKMHPLTFTSILNPLTGRAFSVEEAQEYALQLLNPCFQNHEDRACIQQMINNPFAYQTFLDYVNNKLLWGALDGGLYDTLSSHFNHYLESHPLFADNAPPSFGPSFRESDAKKRSCINESLALMLHYRQHSSPDTKAAVEANSKTTIGSLARWQTGLGLFIGAGCMIGAIAIGGLPEWPPFSSVQSTIQFLVCVFGGGILGGTIFAQPGWKPSGLSQWLSNELIAHPIPPEPEEPVVNPGLVPFYGANANAAAASLESEPTPTAPSSERQLSPEQGQAVVTAASAEPIVPVDVRGMGMST